MTDTSLVELKFWESIEKSNDPKDFEAYIRKCPNGNFVELADNRVKSLEAAMRVNSPNPAYSGPISPNRNEQPETFRFKLGHVYVPASFHEGTLFISFADGDCRLIAGGGNRRCAEALRSAILFCNTGLLDITCLYEKIKFETTDNASQSLSETQKAYAVALDHTSQVAFENQVFNPVALHHITCRDVRDITKRGTAAGSAWLSGVNLSSTFH
jgi:hypothetical protein